jgi:hypothetical protein
VNAAPPTATPTQTETNLPCLPPPLQLLAPQLVGFYSSGTLVQVERTWLYVADVTVPDGTQFRPGRLHKTWRLQNSGTNITTTDYALTFFGERSFRLHSSASCPVAWRPAAA